MTTDNERHGQRRLAGLDHWELEHKSQDLRGHDLLDANGQKIGKVDDMLVDLDAEEVYALRLHDGRLVNVDYIDIRDNGVYLLAEGAAAKKTDYDEAAYKRGELDATSVPVIEERLLIAKREVEAGRVRVSKRIVTDTVTEDVTLRDEKVDVRVRETNERLTGAEADAAFKEGSVEVTATSEEAVVAKEAVKTGEVEIDKQVGTRTERVSETVRKTEVEVDDTTRDGKTRRT